MKMCYDVGWLVVDVRMVVCIGLYWVGWGVSLLRGCCLSLHTNFINGGELFIAIIDTKLKETTTGLHTHLGKREREERTNSEQEAKRMHNETVPTSSLA